MEESIPLYIDLDGTLIRSDLAQEMLVRAAARPEHFGALTRLLAQREWSRVKRYLAEHVDFVPESLPYVAAVIDHAKAARALGRRVVLATAADRIAADRIAEHLGIFDAVIASEPGRNMKSRAKLDAIRQDAGSDDFEYIGNSNDDIPIWDAAAARGYVNPPIGVAPDATHLSDGGVLVQDQVPTGRVLLKAMRPHQWSKNALLFVPMILSASYAEPANLIMVIIGFLMFSFCASAIYILNDLVDIEADRAHRTKRNRPFAAGTLLPITGVKAAAFLLGVGLVGGFGLIGSAFGLVLLGYVGLTMAYSLYLKQFSTVDVVTLALLYSVRLLAGAVAISVPLSPWLLNFALFFFLGLAYLKRYIEVARSTGTGRIGKRNYETDEIDFIAMFGIANSALAILTLSLFLNSDAVTETYASPYVLWLLLPLFAQWTFRTWIWAKRGKIDDDPVVFALKDRQSRMIIGLCVVLIVVAQRFPIGGALF